MTAMMIISDPVDRDFLKQLAKERFGDMVKAVVDCKRGVMAVGGELHADEEQLLLENGSMQEDLWGINIYPDMDQGDWVEFDSVINLRPTQGNRSRDVEDEKTRIAIKDTVSRLVDGIRA